MPKITSENKNYRRYPSKHISSVARYVFNFIPAFVTRKLRILPRRSPTRCCLTSMIDLFSFLIRTEKAAVMFAFLVFVAPPHTYCEVFSRKIEGVKRQKIIRRGRLNKYVRVPIENYPLTTCTFSFEISLFQNLIITSRPNLKVTN